MSARKIRLIDHRGRDAVVALEACSLKRQVIHTNASGQAVRPTRLIKSGPGASHQALAGRFGDDHAIAQALIDGDPELDLETVGKETGPCKKVFVDGNGKPLYAARIVEIVYGPDGLERERREPKSYPSNLLDPRPWSGKLLPREVAARRFAFTRKYLVRHVDALTFDFLFSLASYLEQNESLAVIGSSPSSMASRTAAASSPSPPPIAPPTSTPPSVAPAASIASSIWTSPANSAALLYSRIIPIL